MQQDISERLSRCLQCVKIAGGTSIRRPMGEQLVATAPNQILHFDFVYIGKGKKGMVYILVLRCGFSSMVELVPCTEATAEICAEALLQWFSRYGTVKQWVSDQGPHFKNLVIDAVRRATKVQHHFVTPYAPWANGYVERVNREILRVLRALISENMMSLEDWPFLVTIVQSVINQTPTERLGNHSPVQVMTGLIPDHVLDTCFITEPRMERMSDKANRVTAVGISDAVKEHVKELGGALASIRSCVTTMGENKRAANKRAAMKRGWQPHADFQVGDFVLSANTNPDKLSVRWIGPMQVTKIIDNWTSEVQELVHGKKTTRHSAMLKKYVDSELQVTSQLRQQLEHDDCVSYKVEKILNWRQEMGKHVELLIRWLGFDAENDSWEPLQVMMEDIPEKVKKFRDDHRFDEQVEPLIEAIKELL